MTRSEPQIQVEEELLRLQNSRSFARSTAQLRLLRFLIDRGAAEPAGLRETQIGEDFYGREADYDPRDDSIVRVNVNRLRQRLQEYYDGEGEGNPMRIVLPRGSYVPGFMVPETVVPAPPALDAEDDALPGEEIEALPAAAETLPDRVETLPVSLNEPPKERVEVPPGKPEAGMWARSRRILWICGAAVLLAGLTIAAVARFRPVTGRAPLFLTERLTAEPLTSGKSMDFEPAPSRDGRHLAYVRQDRVGHGFHIWLRDAGGTEANDHLLDTGPDSAFYPAWSPDGTTLAFLRCGHRPCEVAIIAAAGGPVHPVRTLPRYTVPDDQPYYQYRQLSPTWTGDGQSLIYPYRGETDTAELLVQHNLQSGRIDVLLDGVPGDEDGAPTVSPDGQRLAFLRRHLTTTDVTILELQSKTASVLQTVPNVTSSGVSWARDGSGVIVGMNEQKGLLLRWLPLHGPPQELPGSMLPFMNPVFGADGKSLLVLNVNRSRDLAIVRGAAGTPTPVFKSKQRNYSSTFSPDGKAIAFLTDRSGRVEIWTAQRRGTDFDEPVQLTRGLTWFPSSLVWSPDGSTLAVGVANSHRIDLVDAHSGLIHPLGAPSLERSVLWSPAWSADSETIFVSAAGEQNGIFRIAAKGTPAVRQIMFGNARELRVDGERALYFTPAYGQGIQKLQLRAGAVPETVPALADILPSRAWVVRSGHLYYLNVWEDERKLHSYDLQSGHDEVATGPLLRPVFADSSIAYLPEQQLLVFSQWTEAAGSQIFVMRW